MSLDQIMTTNCSNQMITMVQRLYLTPRHSPNQPTTQKIEGPFKIQRDKRGEEMKNTNNCKLKSYSNGFQKDSIPHVDTTTLPHKIRAQMWSSKHLWISGLKLLQFRDYKLGFSKQVPNEIAKRDDETTSPPTYL
jgi:hypothetical protein